MQNSIFVCPWEELLTEIDFLNTHSELHKYYNTLKALLQLGVSTVQRGHTPLR